MTTARQQLIDRFQRDYRERRISRAAFDTASQLAGWLHVIEEMPDSRNARQQAQRCANELEGLLRSPRAAGAGGGEV